MKYKKKREQEFVPKYVFVCDWCGEKIYEPYLPKTWVAIFYKNLSYHICDVCKNDPFVQTFLETIHGYSFKENMYNILSIVKNNPNIKIETPLMMGFFDEDYVGSEQFLKRYLVSKSIFGDSFKRR